MDGISYHIDVVKLNFGGLKVMRRVLTFAFVMIFVVSSMITGVYSDDFTKVKALSKMAGERIDDGGAILEPGDGAEPLPPQPPETPVVNPPISGQTTKVFCQFSKIKIL